MRKKPKGRKYRNLVLRGTAIYYERVVDGSRIRFSTETSDWDQAAAVRDLYEKRRGIGKLPLRPADIPTFEEFAERYLDEDTQHLARTTKHERGVHENTGHCLNDAPS